jgi:NitT/TauT family transport system substrate-binding protein/putative hydroxymethylpyrimidine transport system substrate-binding protein
LAALEGGVEETLRDPDAAAREIARASGGTDLPLVRAQLAALRPVVTPPLRLDRPVLEEWADFDARIGIVEERPDVERAFDFNVAR